MLNLIHKNLLDGATFLKLESDIFQKPQKSGLYLLITFYREIEF